MQLKQTLNPVKNSIAPKPPAPGNPKDVGNNIFFPSVA
jgi:hypothetical protein